MSITPKTRKAGYTKHTCDYVCNASTVMVALLNQEWGIRDLSVCGKPAKNKFRTIWLCDEHLIDDVQKKVSR